MKKYLLRASGIAALAVLLSTSVFAQEEREKKSRDDNNKTRLDDNDVIVITKKGGKDTRVVIEVRDGEVTVNGKPLDEYKDGDVTIRRGSRTYTYNGTGQSRVYSPFRGDAQGGTVTWNDNDNLFGATSKATAYLGVVTEKSDEGARITSVSDNTAAEKAGLKEGDVITHIDDANIDDHDDLTKAIRKHKPEDKVNVTFLRDGRERQVVATLGKTGGVVAMTAPSPQFKTVEPKMEFKNNFDLKGTYSFGTGRSRLGIRAQDTEDGKGAKVLKVDDESPADKAGIREDDIITEFEGKDIRNADDLAEAARSVKDQSSMNVRIQRDGRSQTVEIKVPKKLKTTNL